MKRLTKQERQELVNRPELKEHLAALREEFKRRRLTLYLGAGVSSESGLPSWNTLIATLYYTAVSADWSKDWKAYPNYLYAIGEWLLRKGGEAPDVLAGKIAADYGDWKLFTQELRNGLYLPWKKTYGPEGAPDPNRLRHGNRLLHAVAGLCEELPTQGGMHAVVTTNYDSLLELALSVGPAKKRFRPLCRPEEKLKDGKTGIFHVHGYIPAGKPPRGAEEILLTEAQYHSAASNPYSWSNLTLIQCFSASTGLMIGMSMTDRNLRRLLHALHLTQLHRKQYVILREPEVPEMSDCDVKEVTTQAREYRKCFARSGVKDPGKAPAQIRQILEELMRQEKDMVEKMLAKMRVQALWVRDFREVPALVDAVRGA